MMCKIIIIRLKHYELPLPILQSPCITALEKTDSVGWAIKAEINSNEGVANGEKYTYCTPVVMA